MNTNAPTGTTTTTPQHTPGQVSVSGENGENSESAKIDQLLQQTQGLWRGSHQQSPASRITASTSQRQKDDFFTGGLFADDLFTADPAPFAADSTSGAGQSTGHAELDALLPWGAWPQSGLIEVVNKQAGIGELQLLAPLLQARSQQKSSILWIAPPYPLHGPALVQMGVNTRNSFVVPAQTSCNQALWSIEKALQSQECGLVLAWQNWLSARVIRRLQLAAREGNTLGILFHQRPAAHSPSTLQLQLSSAPVSEAGYRNMDVQVLKARGSHRQGRVRIKLPC